MNQNVMGICIILGIPLPALGRSDVSDGDRERITNSAIAVGTALQLTPIGASCLERGGWRFHRRDLPAAPRSRFVQCPAGFVGMPEGSNGPAAQEPTAGDRSQGGSPASGSRTRPHAFVHDTSCPSRLRRRTPSPKQRWLLRRRPTSLPICDEICFISLNKITALTHS